MVSMTSPRAGSEICPHVPYFAIGLHRLANTERGVTVRITDYGQQLAEQLLREPYESSEPK
jgi:hypothetical protein